MYKHLVKTLPVELMGLNIKEWDEDLPGWVPVEDIFFEITNPDSVFMPNYGLRGYFHYYNQFNKPRFVIDDAGPNILYVSGMPKDTPVEDHLKFRMPNPVWLYCYQDIKIKYLIQVIDTNLQ